MSAPILDVQDLSIRYGWLRAVRSVSFQIAPGEAFGLIGESGSGKTTVAYAVMRYLRGGEAQGRLLLAGRDVMTMTDGELAETRGKVAAMVYQDPMSALNPAIKVGEQIAEAIRLHSQANRVAARTRAQDLLAQVKLPLPAEMMHRYPHQLSGGQQQRVVIAMALACDPKLLIMDEPTTGLDVTTEAVILDLINELRRASGVSVLFISHNMGVIAQVCDRVGVLYAGQLVEEGATAQVLQSPRHPYTIGLMRAMPTVTGPVSRLTAIPGRLPDLRAPPPACVFEPRCTVASDPCRVTMPTLSEAAGHPPGHVSRCHFRDAMPGLLPPPLPVALASDARLIPHEQPLLQMVGLQKTFGKTGALPFLTRRTPVQAVSNVTLGLARGQTLAVVGESGSGKSTLARCVAGLIVPDAGAIRLQNAVLPNMVKQRSRTQQRAVQFIFQNPDAALNPHWTVEGILGRPLTLFTDITGRTARRRRMIDLLEMVNLGEHYLDRRPGEMSGGEKQRIGIARAFAGNPALVICDEPTSALDISVQASILNALLDLQALHGTSYLFISHDLGVVRQIAHRVAIMQHGRIVEIGAPEQVFNAPREAYTRALIAAVPTLERRSLSTPLIAGLEAVTQ